MWRPFWGNFDARNLRTLRQGYSLASRWFFTRNIHLYWWIERKNVIGQFESQFQSDIADLDDTDELVFDENELM